LAEAANLRTADLVAMVAYLAVVIGLGAWAASRSRTTEGYFLGGRAMPGWAVGLSMLGTAISSVTFLAYPGSAYEGNWSRIVPGLMLPIAALLSVWLFVPFYRRTHLTSAYEYFERRFGNWGRTYACLAFTAASAYRMGIILYLLALALRSLTGWNLWAIIIITGAIVTLYTVIGGIEAVIWTDVMQTIILVLGGLITVAVVFLTVPGGAAEVISRAKEIQELDNPAEMAHRMNALALEAGYRDAGALERLLISQIQYAVRREKSRFLILVWHLLPLTCVVVD